MKFFIYLILFSISFSSWAKDYLLSESKGTYTVKHLVKTVNGESKDIKGKIACDKDNCEFLLAVPAKSFVSSDSNRDLNMQGVLETAKFSLITAKGKFPQSKMQEKEWTVQSAISVHGVEKNYDVKIKATDATHMNASFILKLDDHHIERPSLLTFKIENEVPLEFNLVWKE